MSAPRRHLGAGAAMSVLAQAGPLIAAAALSVVLARTIGPSGTGRFALLITLVGIASMVVSLGLHAGITYEVSRRRWSVAHAFRTSYRVALVLGLFGALVGLGVFALLRETVFDGIEFAVALIALASLPAVIAYEYAAAIMLARERYEAYALLLIAHAAALLVVGAGLAIPFGLTGAAIGILVSALVGAAYAARLLVDEAHRDETLRQRRLACARSSLRPAELGREPAPAAELPRRRRHSRRLRRRRETSASTRSRSRSPASRGSCRRRSRRSSSHARRASKRRRSRASWTHGYPTTRSRRRSGTACC